jgi:hypothetical protein
VDTAAESVDSCGTCPCEPSVRLWTTFGLNQRGVGTPPLCSCSAACGGDRRRDPTPIHTSNTGLVTTARLGPVPRRLTGLQLSPVAEVSRRSSI